MSLSLSRAGSASFPPSPALRSPALRSPVLTKEGEESLRAPAHSEELAVSVGSTTHLERQSARAAAPAKAIWQDEEATHLELTVPTASPENTELIWEPIRQQLSVGVWSRGRRQGRLCWHAFSWRPEADGRHAQARLRRGKLHVRLPHVPLRDSAGYRLT
ncbi:MAG TPA: hypothetical protein VFS67_16300 [Polyangiaceae bacterium]|nr:hypothetical protein [Polyangiaceae bacterium]